ncbi:MAG: base excision DNA repair protein [Candidatus Dactylopiibacterium sp.]|nr:base excision DNA repair protein [Candidatus Dactylopiibacterium sp.]
MPSCVLPLPEGFRARDLFAFHGRDASALAETVQAGSLRKGIVWQGRPAVLMLTLTPAEARATLTGAAGEGEARALLPLVRRMLGLAQAVETFEATHAAHAQIGALIARQRGLRVPATATPFEALSWAITGQQISLAAALSLRRRLILACGLRADGLGCYPDAAAILALAPAALREAGFSAAKAATLRTVATAVADGALPLDDWSEALPSDAAQRLLACRGVGPWTVDYTLLRGFGWLDGSLHGDAAVRRALQRVLGLDARPDAETTRRWLLPFAPWRALVGAHLWASLADGAG